MSLDVSPDSARDHLRREHRVVLVSPAQEGTAAHELPAGVYGFTASPILASPLFAVRRYRNFEVHRLPTGTALVGFVTPAEAARLSQPTDEPVTLQIFPEAEGDATTLVSIAYDRVAQHRQDSRKGSPSRCIPCTP
jgi:hypothetical protein